jgi:hypothetical protein
MVRIYNHLRKKRRLKAFSEWKNGFLDPINMYRTFNTIDQQRTDVLGLHPLHLILSFITSNFGAYWCKVKISLCFPWRRKVEWRFSSVHPLPGHCDCWASLSEKRASVWVAPHGVRKSWRKKNICYYLFRELNPGSLVAQPVHRTDC